MLVLGLHGSATAGDKLNEKPKGVNVGLDDEGMPSALLMNRMKYAGR
jgi:hypothetical protein